MKKLRYGIMGTASIIDRFVGAVRASGQGEVHALASRSLEKAREKGEKLNIGTCYGSYEEMVKDEEIDVIYVPTINHAHKENAMLALRSGKHVVVEKPMTLSEKDTRELFALAKEKKLFIMEAQKSLFLPVTLQVKEMLDQGLLGRVHLMEYRISVPEVGFKWFYDLPSGGGAVFGSGNYILAHSQYLLSDSFTSLRGMATLSEKGVDLQCMMMLKSSKGVLVEGKITTLIRADSELNIYGEKGRVRILDFWKARRALVEIRGEEVREIQVLIDYEMVYEVDHINSCILQGLTESPVMSERLSVESARLIDELWKDFLQD